MREMTDEKKEANARTAWCETAAGEFSLYVNGVLKVTNASPARDTAKFHSSRDAEPKTVVIPDSRPFFDEIENRLGIPTVPDFELLTAAQTSPREVARKGAERYRTLFPQPSHEPYDNVHNAYQNLTAYTHAKPLPPEAEQAASLLCETGEEVYRNKGRWSAAARTTFTAARDNLRSIASTLEPNSHAHIAYIYCEKADATLHQARLVRDHSQETPSNSKSKDDPGRER
jgi:hypothetical protein